MKASVAVDKVGRMVLPKKVREAIGIYGPMQITVEVIGNAAQIVIPEAQPSQLHHTGGRTVYTGPLPEDWDSGEAVLQMREQRIRR